MMKIFRDAWPATVSEMLQDTSTAHGMVFQSLMVTGGLIGMNCNFAALSPQFASKPEHPFVVFAIGLVHLLRRLLLAGAVGFCFAPARGKDHSVKSLRDQRANSSSELSVSKNLKHLGVDGAMIKRLGRVKRAELGRVAVIGSVHVILASTMLSSLPNLELISLLFDVYSGLPTLVSGASWDYNSLLTRIPTAPTRTHIHTTVSNGCKRELVRLCLDLHHPVSLSSRYGNFSLFVGFLFSFSPWIFLAKQGRS